MGLVESLLFEPVRFSVWVAARSDGLAGTGTLSDPYDGSTAAKLDALLNSLGSNVCVHLGPGEFQTNGYYDGISGTYWQAKSGMRIVGSGIDVTTIKLVNSAATTQRVYAIGHALSSSTIDFFEVCDLTIDCNLGGVSGTTSTAGAVRVMGNHARVARVKVKNWGNKNTGTAGYVIAMLTGDPSNGITGVVNCGIQDCIAISPHASAAGPVTVLHVGGKETATTSEEAFGLGVYIRNCFIDCGPTPDFTKDFRALSMAWCKGGVVEGNQLHNLKHAGPMQTATGARDIMVRGNTYRNVYRGPHWTIESQGVQRLVVEHNWFELATTAADTFYAIELTCSTTTPYLHGTIIIRENQIRYLDSAAGDANAIRIVNASKVVVQENIVEVSPSTPVSNKNCGAATYFNNKTPAGVLVRGYNDTGSPSTSFLYSELETDAEDALLMTLI